MGVLKNRTEKACQATSNQVDQAVARCRDACDGLALLNIGCGGRSDPRWINADLVPQDDTILQVDVSARLPFEDNSLDAVFHAHMLEHLEPEVGHRLIKECARVLRPGGVLRVSVPDFERFAREYLKNLEAGLEGQDGADDRYDWSMLEMLDQLIRTRQGGRMRDAWMIKDHPAADYITERVGGEYHASLKAFENYRTRFGHDAPSMGPHDHDPAPSKLAEFRNSGEIHRWMYDRFSLPRLMVRVGFDDPRVVSPTESRIPGWAQYALEAMPDGSAIKPDSLTVEAVKP